MRDREKPDLFLYLRSCTGVTFGVDTVSPAVTCVSCYSCHYCVHYGAAAVSTTLSTTAAAAVSTTTTTGVSTTAAAATVVSPAAAMVPLDSVVTDVSASTAADSDALTATC
jgi:hypothetical protein